MANENKNRKTTKIKRERARKELIINIEIAAVKAIFSGLMFQLSTGEREEERTEQML